VIRVFGFSDESNTIIPGRPRDQDQETHHTLERSRVDRGDTSDRPQNYIMEVLDLWMPQMRTFRDFAMWNPTKLSSSFRSRATPVANVESWTTRMKATLARALPLKSDYTRAIRRIFVVDALASNLRRIGQLQICRRIHNLLS